MLRIAHDGVGILWILRDVALVTLVDTGAHTLAACTLASAAVSVDGTGVVRATTHALATGAHTTLTRTVRIS